MVRLLTLATVAILAGCEAWAFKDYNQRSTSFIVLTPDCKVEVHEGNIAGGPAAGTPQTAPDSQALRPDINEN